VIKMRRSRGREGEGDPGRSGDAAVLELAAVPSAMGLTSVADGGVGGCGTNARPRTGRGTRVGGPAAAPSTASHRRPRLCFPPLHSHSLRTGPHRSHGPNKVRSISVSSLLVIRCLSHDSDRPNVPPPLRTQRQRISFRGSGWWVR
jgi:hypothetical protein